MFPRWKVHWRSEQLRQFMTGACPVEASGDVGHCEGGQHLRLLAAIERRSRPRDESMRKEAVPGEMLLGASRLLGA